RRFISSTSPVFLCCSNNRQGFRYIFSDPKVSRTLALFLLIRLCCWPPQRRGPFGDNQHPSHTVTLLVGPAPAGPCQDRRDADPTRPSQPTSLCQSRQQRITQGAVELCTRDE